MGAHGWGKALCSAVVACAVMMLAVIPVQAAPGDVIMEFGRYGTGDGELFGPVDFAVDADGNIYVAEMSNHRIQVFDSEGNFLRKWGSYGFGVEGQFYFPNKVAVDARGRVYVGDGWRVPIQVFDGMGNFLYRLGSAGFGDGQFRHRIYGMAFDREGNIHVLNYGNGRMEVFDSEGNFLRNWPFVWGDEEGQLRYPRGMDLDAEGNIYIAEMFNHRVSVFDPDGNFLRVFASLGYDDGHVGVPFGVGIDHAGNVYVRDMAHDLQVFDSAGNFLVRMDFGDNKALDNVYRNLAFDLNENILVNRKNSVLLLEGLGQLNAPPTADAGPDQVVECVSRSATLATLSGSGSTDSDGDELAYSWEGVFGSATGVSTTVSMPYGASINTLTVDDGKGGTDSDAMTVTVEDTTAPAVSLAISGTELLPDVYLGEVVISLSAADSCSGVGEAHYSLDGTDVVVPGSVATVTVSDNGSHTMEYYGVDTLGNTGDARSLAFDVVSSGEGIATLIDYFIASGAIESQMQPSLRQQIANADLSALLNHIEAQAGKKISTEAAEALMKAITYLTNN